MKLVLRTLSLFLVFNFVFFHPTQLAYAADGDDATFYIQALNGHEGAGVGNKNENEVMLVVDTDNAAINHLIFDMVDTSCFDITGVSDPISFVLSGNSVLGTQVTFTTASGDYGYDLASSNPANVGTYDSLHFVTLTADKNDPDGPGCTLSYDTDTAVYVNTIRKGIFAGSYTVAPNEPPVVTLPKIGGVDLSASTVAPSAVTPLPPTLIQDVAVNANLSFVAQDPTDASVQRKARIYKRLDDGSWGYVGSPTKSYTINRSGSSMNFSWNVSGLEFSTYYKVQYIATDDQGASSNDDDADDSTFYFSTQADNIPPTASTRAIMTFISDSDDRSKVISQISFNNASDNSAVDNYYLWTKEYLVNKDIINSDGTRDLDLDTDVSGSVSDEEFNVALRALATGGNYLATMTRSSAGGTPYFRITGNDVDRIDDNNTGADATDDLSLIDDSLMEDIIYLVASDDAQTLAGASVPNFSSFKIVEKVGDFFGARTTLDIAGTDYDYLVGEGSLDVWDAVYTYRNIIGLAGTYPILKGDYLHSSLYAETDNYSTSAATLTE